jgi:hypothetical protein
MRSLTRPQVGDVEVAAGVGFRTARTLGIVPVEHSARLRQVLVRWALCDGQERLLCDFQVLCTLATPSGPTVPDGVPASRNGSPGQIVSHDSQMGCLMRRKKLGMPRILNPGMSEPPASVLPSSGTEGPSVERSHSTIAKYLAQRAFSLESRTWNSLVNGGRPPLARSRGGTRRSGRPDPAFPSPDKARSNAHRWSDLGGPMQISTPFVDVVRSPDTLTLNSAPE